MVDCKQQESIQIEVLFVEYAKPTSIRYCI